MNFNTRWKYERCGKCSESPCKYFMYGEYGFNDDRCMKLSQEDGNCGGYYNLEKCEVAGNIFYLDDNVKVETNPRYMNFAIKSIYRLDGKTYIQGADAVTLTNIDKIVKMEA